MRKSIYFLSIAAAALFLIVPDLDARGGGRGGSARGNPGRSVQRSPSMSRSAGKLSNRTQPASHRTDTKSRPQTRVQPSQNRPRDVSPRPVDRRAVDPGDNLREIERRREATRGSPRTQSADRQNLGNRVRNEVRTNRPDHAHWFNNDFWDHHHYRPPYYHYHNDWWKWATPVAIGAWLGWNSSPIYYDYYGAPGAYYWGPSVNVEVPVYVDPSDAIEAAASQQMNDDWMPLGVFALSSASSVAYAPNIYLQLALNKDGIISGSYYNSTTNQEFGVWGIVDHRTQVVVMKVIQAPDSPVLETGLYNLTQPEAPVRVHFDDGGEAEMLLTRLESTNS